MHIEYISFSEVLLANVAFAERDCNPAKTVRRAFFAATNKLAVLSQGHEVKKIAINKIKCNLVRGL